MAKLDGSEQPKVLYSKLGAHEDVKAFLEQVVKTTGKITGGTNEKAGVLSLFISCLLAHSAMALSEAYKDNVYQTGRLKPIDSVLKVKNGQKAPEFTSLNKR